MCEMKTGISHQILEISTFMSSRMTRYSLNGSRSMSSHSPRKRKRETLEKRASESFHLARSRVILLVVFDLCLEYLRRRVRSKYLPSAIHCPILPLVAARHGIERCRLTIRIGWLKTMNLESICGKRWLLQFRKPRQISIYLHADAVVLANVRASYTSSARSEQREGEIILRRTFRV
jgi:hypothetical protein